MEDFDWVSVSEDNFVPLLEVVDAALTKRCVPVRERPLAAIAELIALRLLAGNDGNGIEFDRLVRSPAFDGFAELVAQWYKTNYGSRSAVRQSDELLGFTLARRSPVPIKVPAHQKTPANAPDCVWIKFLGEVLPTENVLGWLSDPVIVKDDDETKALESEIRWVATELRLIHVYCLGIETASNQQLRAFIGGVRTHLEQTATKIVAQETRGVCEAYWELQMAIECALKALLLQKIGSFPPTHKIPELINQVCVLDARFPRGVLDTFPSDREVLKRRYGTGKISWIEAYDHYRATLKAIRSALANMEMLGLIGGAICIKRAPWAT